MKKICKKCMSRYEGETCPLCAKTDEMGRPPQTEKEKKNQRAFLIFLCVVAAAFVLFIFYRNGVFGSRVYEKPVAAYFEAICSKDFDSYIGIMPAEIAKDIAAEREELALGKEEYMRTLYADYFEEFGEDMSVTMYFGRASNVGEEYINNFADDYYEQYGVLPDADAFKQLETNVIFTGSNSTDSIDVVCFLMKDDLNWYMVGCDYKEQYTVDE